GVWFDSGSGIAPTFPTFGGVRAASMIAEVAGHEATIYQSLGVVDASDVGSRFVLNADLGARGFAGRSYSGTMTLGFATGTFDFLGTPGVLDVVENPGLSSDPSTEIVM